MHPPTPIPPPGNDQKVSRLAYGIKDTAIALSIGQTRVWQLIRDGQLTAIKIGGRTLIAATELVDFIARGGTK